MHWRQGRAQMRAACRGLVLFWAVFLAFVPATAHAGKYRDQSVAMAVETGLDLNRYLGKWYEIARFANRFEKGCQGVTAEYSWQDDGTIKVSNTCHEGTPDGPVQVVDGVGQVEGPGKLSINFVSWLPFAKGDYWVLYVDEAYSVAAVGAPNGRTGWILARSPKISKARFQVALSALAKNGYDVSKIELVLH